MRRLHARMKFGLLVVIVERIVVLSWVVEGMVILVAGYWFTHSVGDWRQSAGAVLSVEQ